MTTPTELGWSVYETRRIQGEKPALVAADGTAEPDLPHEHPEDR